jgi:hypothetical protein
MNRLSSPTAQDGRPRRRLERDLTAARGIVLAVITGLMLWGAILLALVRALA